MIELCFGESLAGSLQYAIAMKKDDTRFDAAAVGVIGGTRKERAQALREAKKPKPWQGEPLDISPADVFRSRSRWTGATFPICLSAAKRSIR